MNDPRVHIEFGINDAKTTNSIIITNYAFLWKWKIDSTLVEMLKNNWDSQLQYVVSLFNTSCDTNITKTKIKIKINIYNQK
jgi:hypothetical protein